MVKVGTPVKIFSEQSGQSIDGSLSAIAAFSNGEDGSTPQSQPGYPILVKGKRPLNEKLAGQDVRITIDAASTEGPVLVVPASAIYTSSNGKLQVIKLNPDSSQTKLEVSTGATGNGYVEVIAEGLSEGDEVLIGRAK